jgi:hypothetical protein
MSQILVALVLAIAAKAVCPRLLRVVIETVRCTQLTRIVATLRIKSSFAGSCGPFVLLEMKVYRVSADGSGRKTPSSAFLGVFFAKRLVESRGHASRMSLIPGNKRWGLTNSSSGASPHVMATKRVPKSPRHRLPRTVATTNFCPQIASDLPCSACLRAAPFLCRSLSSHSGSSIVMRPFSYGLSNGLRRS